MSKIEESIAQTISELAPTVYKDLAQPGVKKLGEAIGSFIGLVVSPITAFGPIGENNLKKIAERMNLIEDVQEVPPEIGVPILERLRYTQTEALADLYVELFVKAASKNGSVDAHPAYLEVISGLSGNEAKILEYVKPLTLNGRVLIPYINIYEKLNPTEGDGEVVRERYVTGLEDKINLYQRDKLQMNLENLVRIGLLKDIDDAFLTKDSLYKVAEDSDVTLRVTKDIVLRGREIKVTKYYFELTQFGLDFIRICVQ